MSGYIRRKDSLYDPITGALVGYIDANGNEQVGYPVSGAGNGLISLAGHGDSRNNFQGSGANAQVSPDITSASFVSHRAFTWLLASRPDFYAVGSWGVSGDSTSNYANPARSHGKTLDAFAAVRPNLVHISYGINDYYLRNDVPANYAAILAATAANLKGLTTDLIARGAKVLFESVNHCTQTGYGSDASTKRSLTNDINAQMRAWLAGNVNAVYVDTNALIVAADGYGDPANYIDNIHYNQTGALIAGQALAQASLVLFPLRPQPQPLAPQYPNLLRAAPALTQTNTVTGTFSATAVTPGYDGVSGRSYLDLTFTASALASGSAQVRFDIHAAVGSYSAATPDFTVAAGELYRSRASLTIGSNVAGVYARQRTYREAGAGGGTVFVDWGDLAGITTLPQGLPIYPVTPGVPMVAGSANIEAPANGKGMQFQVFVQTTSLSAGSVRLWLPDMRRVS